MSYKNRRIRKAALKHGADFARCHYYLYNHDARRAALIRANGLPLKWHHQQ